MQGSFYGWQEALMPAVDRSYPGIETPRDLYDALLHVWRAETCAPRMRQEWSAENPTLGQCSITAFLAQDIFGGQVHGVPLKGGGFHCFNVVDGKTFDLTSEQFGDGKLIYDDRPLQYREVHFAGEEKLQRYEMLKQGLRQYLQSH